jgi:hypothetical protein
MSCATAMCDCDIVCFLCVTVTLGLSTIQLESTLLIATTLLANSRKENAKGNVEAGVRTRSRRFPRNSDGAHYSGGGWQRGVNNISISKMSEFQRDVIRRDVTPAGRDFGLFHIAHGGLSLLSHCYCTPPLRPPLFNGEKLPEEA